MVGVLSMLQDIVANNKLLYAWPQVKRIKSELKKKVRARARCAWLLPTLAHITFVRRLSQCALKVNDQTGRLKFTVQAGEYKFQVRTPCHAPEPTNFGVDDHAPAGSLNCWSRKSILRRPRSCMSSPPTSTVRLRVRAWRVSLPLTHDHAQTPS